MSAEFPLLIFAKAPVAGQVKTRLQPQCTELQAAEIARILLRATARQACEHWPGTVVLALWPDTNDAYAQALAREFNIELVAQPAGDLGDKMHGAFETHGYPAAILGSDIPHVSAEQLAQAYAWLEQDEQLIGPTDDGGYYLIGLSRAQPALFTDMSWGVDTVLDTTRQRAREQGMDLRELSPNFDIDLWADIERAAPLLPELQAYLVEQGLR